MPGEFAAQIPTSPAQPPAQFKDRLVKPEWDIVERGLGRGIPAVLRELYSDPTHVLYGYFFIAPPLWAGLDDSRAYVDSFLPADAEALRPYGIALPTGAIAFADDERGNPYIFFPGNSTEGDGAVHILQAHRGSALVKVTESLRVFLTLPRQYAY